VLSRWLEYLFIGATRDKPDQRYQFPKSYLSRAKQFEGDWVVYREPVKAGNKGFYAIALVEKIVPDPTKAEHFLALIKPGSYLDFPYLVPHRLNGQLVESDLRTSMASVRTLSPRDFAKIVGLGLGDHDDILPRTDQLSGSFLAEDRSAFAFDEEQERRQVLTNRTVRDAAFRKVVIEAYECRCAFSGLKIINGGGRAEVEAAHIKPVSANGPDSVNNGLALSGTLHWMFDRGLLTLDNDFSIKISRHVNDFDSAERLLLPNLRAIVPSDPYLHPRADFIAWHQEHVFKH